MSKLIEKEGRFYKECGVVMLETTNESSILEVTMGKIIELRSVKQLAEDNFSLHHFRNSKPQNLYITSDDEIKKGDWYIIEFNGLKLTQCTSDEELISLKGRTDCRKIIATTDTSLNSGLQKGKLYQVEAINTKYEPVFIPQPSDSFIQAYIEAYNKGEKIEKVW